MGVAALGDYTPQGDSQQTTDAAHGLGEKGALCKGFYGFNTSDVLNKICNCQMTDN